MLDALTFSPLEPICTFVAPDGTNTHIAANRLRLHCLSIKPEIVLVPVDPHLAFSFIEDNIVSTNRLKELWHRPLLDPIIFCKDGTFTDGRPDVMLVDGHHRFTLAAARRQRLIKAHVLDEAIWHPFRIVGTGKNYTINTTQERLKALPIKPRNY